MRYIYIPAVATIESPIPWMKRIEIDRPKNKYLIKLMSKYTYELFTFLHSGFFP